MRFQEAFVRDELSVCIVNKKIYKCLEMRLYSILATSKYNLHLRLISSEYLHCLSLWHDYETAKLGYFHFYQIWKKQH